VIPNVLQKINVSVQIETESDYLIIQAKVYRGFQHLFSTEISHIGTNDMSLIDMTVNTKKRRCVLWANTRYPGEEVHIG